MLNEIPKEHRAELEAAVQTAADAHDLMAWVRACRRRYHFGHTIPDLPTAWLVDAAFYDQAMSYARGDSNFHIGHDLGLADGVLMIRSIPVTVKE